MLTKLCVDQYEPSLRYYRLNDDQKFTNNLLSERFKYTYSLYQAKGYDTSCHVLACFGGAGGQHACAIARSLGMGTVFVHKYAGILSAYGMALADVVEEAQEPSAEVYEQGIV